MSWGFEIGGWFGGSMILGYGVGGILGFGSILRLKCVEHEYRV